MPGCLESAVSTIFVLMRMQRSRKQSQCIISVHLIFFGSDETNGGVGNYQAFGIDQVLSEQKLLDPVRESGTLWANSELVCFVVVASVGSKNVILAHKASVHHAHLFTVLVFMQPLTVPVDGLGVSFIIKIH